MGLMAEFWSSVSDELPDRAFKLREMASPFGVQRRRWLSLQIHCPVGAFRAYAKAVNQGRCLGDQRPLSWAAACEGPVTELPATPNQRALPACCPDVVLSPARAWAASIGQVAESTGARPDPSKPEWSVVGCRGRRMYLVWADEWVVVFLLPRHSSGRPCPGSNEDWNTAVVARALGLEACMDLGSEMLLINYCLA
ncbi:uncharacterized protein B0I36DRAFT_403698 [Microdochium trichocladiopsis]|uniref:Uncharacterized protein n=1 Tax=Microdochium trichocladiopsis TaxID=1682393 RepID=A0A9P8YCC0_9PEZI|nr:uncharacterized protein B0I36DRAFT_403698 [Microdochium trichocladiopsis]KAH7038131.1 hypothetical protein B0I36DRAFT_403698 [Microdochium trichocladiopsis]